MKNLIEELQENRNRLLEFLIVVIVVGIAVDILAGIIYELTEPDTDTGKYIYLALLIGLLIIIFFFIYLRAPANVRSVFSFEVVADISRQDDAFFYSFRDEMTFVNSFTQLMIRFIPITSIETYELHNSLTISAYLGETILFDTLSRAFSTYWSHDYLGSKEEIISITGDTQDILSFIPKEKFEGRRITFRDLNRESGNPLYLNALASVHTDNLMQKTLVIPPNTELNINRDFEESFHKVSYEFKNRYIEVNISLSPTYAIMHSDGLEFGYRITYDGKFARSFMVLPHYEYYYIWAKRLILALKQTFKEVE